MRRSVRRWTVNGRFLGRRVTGVQRYGRQILLALDALVSKGHPLASDLALDLMVPASAEDVPDLHAIRVRRRPGPSGPLWEQAVLGVQARGGVLNLCNTAPLWRPRQIVCLHDANVWLVPDSYSRPFRSFYRATLPWLGRTAARVATVSGFSAGEFARLGVAQRCAVIPNGHEHALEWDLGPAASGDMPDTGTGPALADTVVVIASEAPHKNVGLILSLADRLAAMGLRVALIGGADARVHGCGTGRPRPDHAGVLRLGTLPDRAMAGMLRGALCLAVPSLTEGFGLPALEAMALGCPVVSSDRASLPGVCGEAALYAAPDRPEAWLAAFARLRDEPGLRADLVRRGRERAACFSWMVSAEQYLNLMAEVDGCTGDEADG